MAYFANNESRLVKPYHTAVFGFGQEVIVFCVKELTRYASLEEFILAKSMGELKKFYFISQIDAIKNGDLGYNQLDVSDLYSLAKDECGIDESDWKTEGTLAYFIKKIKDERNELAHQMHNIKLTRYIVVSKLEEVSHIYRTVIKKLGEQRCAQGGKMSTYEHYADSIAKRLDDLKPEITVADLANGMGDLSMEDLVADLRKKMSDKSSKIENTPSHAIQYTDKETFSISNHGSRQKRNYCSEENIKLLEFSIGLLGRFELDDEMEIKNLRQTKWRCWISIGVGATAVVVSAGLFGNPQAWEGVFFSVVVAAVFASRAVNDVVTNTNAGKRIVQYGKVVKEQLQKIREAGIEELEVDEKLFNIYFDEIESDGAVSTGFADYLLATYGPTSATAKIISENGLIILPKCIEDKLITTVTSTSSSTVMNMARNVGLPLVIGIGVAYAFYNSVFEHPSIEKVKKLNSELKKLSKAMDENIVKMKQIII